VCGWVWWVWGVGVGGEGFVGGVVVVVCCVGGWWGWGVVWDACVMQEKRSCPKHALQLRNAQQINVYLHYMQTYVVMHCSSVK